VPQYRRTALEFDCWRLFFEGRILLHLIEYRVQKLHNFVLFTVFLFEVQKLLSLFHVSSHPSPSACLQNEKGFNKIHCNMVK